MASSLSRRDALKLGSLATAALAFRPIPPVGDPQGFAIARVAATWIGLYHEPSFRAPRRTRLLRDEIVTLLGRETADAGPIHNPLWYQLADGYAHSGNLQIVKWNLQTPLHTLPAEGALFEVAVPYTRSHRQADPASDPIYRLYYLSTHWVDAIATGADGRVWYRILDDILYIHYFVRAEHLRRVEPGELTPISPEVPPREKRIEVSLSAQEVRAFEGDQLVLRTRISSGIPDSRPKDNGIPTITPSGAFAVSKKTPMRHMGDGHVTADLEAYELPGVPWVSFFHETGVGFHGTYWHTDFGIPRSHGCINMRPEEAKWLYRWTTPAAGVSDRLTNGRGTAVWVR
ncbi:MAG TPA: L,D-transpeptidase [Anaerolineales bacterium]|nr:L,D-transpeptidase [Anaerolineales bacterium]